ncbi:Slowpoke-binding protein [Gryllus bimaculatus]|nr:Slowpoke-binding protein [Gryllus bimaculatus]
MCAGYELCASRPSAGQLADLAGYPAVQQILDLIFQPADGRFPGLQELLVLDFFRNIDLREMRAAPLPLKIWLYSSSATNIKKDL